MSESGWIDLGPTTLTEDEIDAINMVANSYFEPWLLGTDEGEEPEPEEDPS